MDHQDRYRELEEPSHTGNWNGELLKRAAEAAAWQSDDRKSGWVEGILYGMLRTVRERAKGRTTDQRVHNRPASTNSANYVTLPGDHDPAEKALAAIERVIRTIGNEYLQGTDLALLAELRAEMGEFDTAEGMAYAIPSPEPKAHALAAIGRIQIRAGSVERASELLKAAEDTAELLESAEDQAWMLENVVLIWADAEQWEKAQSTLLKMSPEEPDAKATAYQELAERLLRSNRSEEARSILIEAASIAPMNSRTKS